MEPTTKRRRVAGCIPIGRPTDTSAPLKILFVTSNSHPQMFILPKGGIEENETAQDAALRETWEEAGVCGEITRFVMEMKDGKSITQWFEMSVGEQKSEWPEMEARRRKWMTLDEALESSWVKEKFKLVLLQYRKDASR